MGKLYVVPTPIGNLSDLTLRSIDILNSVEVILCEDTKVTGKIKKHLSLSAKLISLHKFNEISRIKEVTSLLEKHDVALVSDAGTPTISDPGQILVKEVSNKFEVIALPGANAITTALSGSGLEFSSFTFIGFLEKSEKRIIEEVSKHLDSDVIIAYESPNRIVKTLEFLLNAFGDFKISIARELTKVYEENIHDNLSILLEKEYKGEIVLLIPTKELQIKKDISIYIEPLLKQGMSNKGIVSYLTETSDLKKNDIYDYLKNII